MRKKLKRNMDWRELPRELLRNVLLLLAGEAIVDGESVWHSLSLVHRRWHLRHFVTHVDLNERSGQLLRQVKDLERLTALRTLALELPTTLSRFEVPRHIHTLSLKTAAFERTPIRLFLSEGAQLRELWLDTSPAQDTFGGCWTSLRELHLLATWGVRDLLETLSLEPFRLEVLVVYGCGHELRGLRRIGPCADLRELKLGSFKGELCGHGGWPVLERLTLNLGEQQLEPLQSFCHAPVLHRLKLVGLGQRSEGVQLAPLLSLPSLAELVLENLPLRDEQLQLLECLSGLRHLELIGLPSLPRVPRLLGLIYLRLARCECENTATLLLLDPTFGQGPQRQGQAHLVEQLPAGARYRREHFVLEFHLVGGHLHDSLARYLQAR